MQNDRVLVVGGGIVGCLSAIEIKKKGFDVSVVDQSSIGQQSSWAAGGILFPLMPWDYSKEVYKLCFNSKNYYQKLAKELLQETGIDCELLCSSIAIKEPNNRDKILSWCSQNKMEINVNEKEIILKEIFQIRPPRLMKALRVFMKNLGIKIIENKKITNFHESDGKIKYCLSSEGDLFKADVFILCSGAWTSSILKEYKDIVFPVKGQMIQYPNTSLNLKHIMYKNGFYLIPRKDGVLVAGSTLEKVGFNSEDTIKNINILKRKAESLVPELKKIEISKSWHGFRPGTEGNIPFIQKHKNNSNLLLNFGHYRYGIAMAPRAAQLITNLTHHLK